MTGLKNYIREHPLRTAIFIVLAMFLAGTGAFFAIHAQQEPEPSFEGQALSRWLADLNFSGDIRDTKARKAIAQMGTNILPRLGPMFRARDADLKRRFMRMISKQSFIKINYTPAEVHQQRASCACRVLGAAAVCYVPELRTMLDDQINGSTAWCGMVALLDVKSRAECLVELKKGLTNHYHLLRALSATVIGSLGSNATSALPALIKVLSDPDPQVRKAVVDTMPAFRSQAATIGPALGMLLCDPDTGVRDRARTVLMALDPSALFPTLVRCLTDPNPGARADAAHWLQFLREAQTNASAIVSPLMRCLSDTNPAVRAEAALALGSLRGGASNALERLKDCTDDRDDRVRQNARQALRMIR